ncbi:NAD(P)H-hydrate dehydratase [Pseudoalteromonas rhizosphaerae]|uniref:NAD(P)H-hydrate dehydratase n=1 Tax=Pseudoalteromonas rhizosphaerae TaxID=2518973 RepID=UPI00384FD1BA
MQNQGLAQQLFLAKQVREHEAKAATLAGVSMFTLMERAGHAVFSQCIEHFPNAQRYFILVGYGNNAGDGYIVASLAKQAGKEVIVLAADTSRHLTGDALTAQQRWQALGGEVESYTQGRLNNADIIIDGLLGTGINSQVRRPFLTMIEDANAQPSAIVAIDLPSGIDADTGQPLGIAIHATITVTFVGIKQGLVTGAGRSAAGKIIFNDLGIAESFTKLVDASATLINITSFKPLAARSRNSHKGDHGKLLCVGGNQGTSGAIRLSSEAALRTGAAMVRVYTHQSSVQVVSSGRPELMVSCDSLSAALAWANCVIIGPGLGQDNWAQIAFEQVIQYCLANNLPLVIDADGLNLLAKHALEYRLKNCIITPHAGEASRLMKVSIAEIEANRFQSATDLAKRYTSTSVLKGAGSLIANGQQTWLCENGNPALAVGGSGDVLTGIIGALLAQGFAVDQAACYGVTLHAKAADILAEREGERGMLPSDLFAIVRQLINGK